MLGADAISPSLARPRRHMWRFCSAAPPGPSVAFQVARLLRDASGDASPAELTRVFFLQLEVIGSTMGTRDELADLLRFVANKGISPEIGLELPMEKAADGFRAMLDGDTAGKIVFTR